jgi:quercetin dioxygenase-like cupin family protein
MSSARDVKAARAGRAVVIVEGAGEWNLDGKWFAAAKGDAIYTEPWVVHGIKDTGTTPLTFVVFKWNTKGMAVPKQRATD